MKHTKKHLCFANLLVLALSILSLNARLYAQDVFTIDDKGHINDPRFLQIIKAKGYSLVGAFDTLQKKPAVLAAYAFKNGKETSIDTKGELFRIYLNDPILTNASIRYEDIPKYGIKVDVPAPPMDDYTDKVFEQYLANNLFGTRNIATKAIALPAMYNSLQWWNHKLILTRIGRKYGFAYSDGTVLLPPKYDQIYRHGEGFARYVIVDSNKYGLLDSNFKEIMKPQYQFIMHCVRCNVADDRMIVGIDNKQALLTEKGKTLIPPLYKTIIPLGFEWPVSFTVNNKWGMVTITNRILLEPVYDEIQPDEVDGLIKLKKDNLYGFTNLKGKLIVGPVYDQISQFYSNVAIVQSGKKEGLIDKRGSVIVPLAYDHLTMAGTDILATNNTKTGLLNTKGKTLVPVVYNDLAVAGNNLYFFKLNGRLGLMNIAGKVLISYTFEDAEFAKGYLIIKKDNKYGLADLQGNVLVPVKYDKLSWKTANFYNRGIFSAQIDGRNCLIDLYGNELYN